MKVIDGGFGKDVPEGDPKVTLLEAITGALEDQEMDTMTEGVFFLVLDTDKRTTFITNEVDRPQAAFLLEMAKLTVMGAI